MCRYTINYRLSISFSLIFMSASSIFTQSDHLVRVLTFNILHGATTNHDFNLDTIAAIISRVNPDLVALQEVDFKTRRALNYDLVTELGWRTGLAPLFGRAMPYDGGEYGEGILSKWSFISTRNVMLPYSPGNEPRAALEITTIMKSGDTISFVGTHLDHLHDDTDRIAQAREINAVFSSNRYPTILAGDLNDVPGSRPINLLEAHWTPAYRGQEIDPTFPSHQPAKKIDYVMYRPATRWKVLSRQVICDEVASDHCALLVVLELTN
jgi:endonuclease/exonuclease/phosphatase family metal-dependent hydrolase